MKTTPFLDYVLYDVFNEKDNVTLRAMMGGYILYKEGKVFALVEEDTLWLKGSDTVKEWYLSRGSKKFRYLKKGKSQEMNFFLVPNDVLESKEEFKIWLEVVFSVVFTS